MKPLTLTLENINSYRQKQTVDFSAFMQGGIFGIFGNTGSGKSTILDAMMLALYGEIPRSGARAGRSFINQQADRAEVSLTFACGNQTFRVERSFKVRKSGVDSAAVLLELTPEGELMRAESVNRVNDACEKLLGLNANEFKKVIAIPQGEFAALLKADPKDRLNMLGDLFNLEIYGEKLYQAVSEEARDLESRVGICQAALEALGEVSKERGKELEHQEKLIREKCKELEAEVAASSETLRQAERNRLLTQRLEQCEAAVAEAETKAAELQKAKERLEKLERFRTIEPQFREQERTIGRLKEVAKELEEAERAERECLAEFERLPERDPKADEAQKLELMQRQTKLEEGDKRWNKLQEARKERKKKQDLYKEIQNDLKREGKEVDKLTAQIAAGEADLAKRTARAGELRSQWEQASRLLWSQGRAAGFHEVGEKLTEDKPRVLAPVQDYMGELETFMAGRMPVLPEQAPDENRLKLELEMAERQKETSAKALEQLRQQLTERQAKCEILNSRKEDVIEAGSELKERIGELEKEFEGVTDLGKELQAVRKALQELNARMEGRQGEENRLQQEKTKATARREMLEKQYKEAEERADSAGSEWKLALKKAELTFAEVEEFSSLQEGEKSRLRDEVQKGTSDLEHLRKSLSAAQKECGTRVSPDQIGTLQKTLEEKTGQWEESKADQVRQEEQSRLFRKNREIFEQKEKEKKGLESRLKLVQTLQELVKGRKLLEFAAEEYFISISEAATERLRELTGGRYELKYRDRKFFIADNFAGGAERDVNTLSGGETFLVSLCLAVSLSEAIVSAGAKRLDFFFLDEGFGTLDEDLFDSVMDALEKLQKTHFTIGIISHVPALRQRLSNQLIVEPADEQNGSRIRLG